MRNPTSTTKTAEEDAPEQRPHHVHGQAGDQVVLVDMDARAGGDQHRGQQRGAAREDEAVDGDDDRRPLQVLELGMLDLAVDLSQGLLAAHGQDGVAEGHENPEQAEDRQSASFQKAERVVAELAGATGSAKEADARREPPPSNSPTPAE